MYPIKTSAKNIVLDFGGLVSTTIFMLKFMKPGYVKEFLSLPCPLQLKTDHVSRFMFLNRFLKEGRVTATDVEVSFYC